MLWWDDSPAKNWGKKKNSASQIPSSGGKMSEHFAK